MSEPIIPPITTDRRQAFAEWWSGYCLHPCEGYRADEKKDHMREAFIGGSEWMSETALAASLERERELREGLESLIDECRVHQTSPPDHAWNECICGSDGLHEPDCPVVKARQLLTRTQPNPRPAGPKAGE
jgi:hypothetical protein